MALGIVFLALFMDGFFRAIGLIPPFMGIDINLLKWYNYDNDYFVMYKPYSQEWHRYRYLKEAIDKYLDDYVAPEVILDDIDSILQNRSESALAEYTRVTELQEKLRD